MDRQLLLEVLRTLEDAGEPVTEGAATLPELVGDVGARTRAEQAEASAMLESWRDQVESTSTLGKVLADPSAPATVLAACGATRSFLERLLLDADDTDPVLRIERQRGNDPYCELHVRRSSPLGRAAGWEATDLVDVRVPGHAVASHIARRTGVDSEVARQMWELVYETLATQNAFVHLFSGLDIELGSEGAVQVRLDEAD